MPSPFPGMDPYIEMFEWEDFHTRFVVSLCDELAAKLPAGYAARVEQRSYVEVDLEFQEPEAPSPPRQTIIPDLAVSETSEAEYQTSSAETATLLMAEPQVQHLPRKIERRETYLEIREIGSRKVITALELLSPSNKRAATDSGRLYTEKRLAVLESQSHFVELDLLRGGQRILLSVPGLPTGCDYYAFVSRAERRPDVELYPWKLQDRMPVIPIPLKPEHGHVPLDLQHALMLTYDRARYQNTLDYRQPLSPPLRPGDDGWLRSLLKSPIAVSQPTK